MRIVLLLLALILVLLFLARYILIAPNLKVLQKLCYLLALACSVAFVYILIMAVVFGHAL